MRITVLVVLLAVFLLVLPSSDAFFNRRRRWPHSKKGKKGRPRHRPRGKGHVRGFDYVKKSIDSVEKSIHKPHNMHKPYSRHADYGHSHHPPHSYHHGHYHGPPHGHDHGYPHERKYTHGPPHGAVIYHGDDPHHRGGSPSPGGGHYHWYPDSPSYSQAHHHHFDENQYHDDDYGRSYGEDSHIEHRYGSIKKLRRRKKGKGDHFKLGNTHHPVATYKTVDDSPEDVEELEEDTFPEIESQSYAHKNDLQEIRQYDRDEVQSRYSGSRQPHTVYRKRYSAIPNKKMSYPSSHHPGHSDRQGHYSPGVRSNRDFEKGDVSYYSNRDDETTQSPKMSSEYTFLDEIFVKDDPFNRNFRVSSYTFYNMNDVGSTLLPEHLNIY